MNLPARSKMLCYAALPSQKSFNTTATKIADYGFTELSLWMDAVTKGIEENGSASALCDFLAGRGLRASVLEFMTAWTNTEASEHRAEAERYLDLAVALNAEVVMCGCVEPAISNPTRAIQQLREQCDIVARDDRKLAFEFLPWSAIDTLPKALQLIEQVSRPNLGLVIDTWHLTQAGHTADTLRLITHEPVFIVQLSDVGERCDKGKLLDDTMNARLLPGEGCADWHALSGWFSAHCADAIFGAEVFNADLKEKSLEEALKTLASVSVSAFENTQ